MGLWMKDLLQQKEPESNSSGEPWDQVAEAYEAKKKQQKVSKTKGGLHAESKLKLDKRVSCKKSRKQPSCEMERRIRTLKNLIPNSESVELNGLFRETADYILSLEMKVRLMQVLVHVLAGSDE